MKMKGFAMKKIGETGWVEKDVPACGPLDAIVKPLAVAICTSDIHTIAGAIGERTDMILGHEVCAEVHEVGSLVKDFKKGPCSWTLFSCCCCIPFFSISFLIFCSYNALSYCSLNETFDNT